MGIFDNDPSDPFTVYKVKLACRTWLVGGIPNNEKAASGWLKKSMGLEDGQELAVLLAATMAEMGLSQEAVTPDNLDEAIDKVGEFRGCGFKRAPEGHLYLEARAIKAMLKEVTSILHAGEQWGGRDGYSGKACRSMMAERAFVRPDCIPLLVPGVLGLRVPATKPTGIHQQVIHAQTPQGPRTSLGYYQYVEQPEIEFTLHLLEDFVPAGEWPRFWLTAQQNGLGALRSQGFGQFDILAFDKIHEGAAIPRRKRGQAQSAAPTLLTAGA